MSTSSNETSNNIDVYQIVTNRIITLLEQGTIPWQKPWIEPGIPMNLLSKRPYRGINLWLLLSLNYERNLFLTWDQLKKIGGSVKQGEHGHVVVFWKTLKKNADMEEEERKKNIPLLRYYKVFNIEQCKDIPENLVELKTERHQEHDRLLQCEQIIERMPSRPDIKHKEQKAFYDIERDYINMPRKKSFKTIESYNCTLFYELVHCTGHKKRLNRPSFNEMAKFESEQYSIEELVAEMGAAYLCSLTGIGHRVIENSAAYIAEWLKKLMNDKKFIIRAAGNAQKAVDYILNVKSQESKNEIEQSELLDEN